MQWAPHQSSAHIFQAFSTCMLRDHSDANLQQALNKQVVTLTPAVGSSREHAALSHRSKLRLTAGVGKIRGALSLSRGKAGREQRQQGAGEYVAGPDLGFHYSATLPLLVLS